MPSPDDRRALLDAAREVLGRHQGPERPITMLELHAVLTGEVIIPGRRYDQTRITRSLVEQLVLEHGLPVASGRHGYFLARTDAELQPTIERFHARALSHLKREKALKRATTADLLEQVRIDLDSETPHAP